MRREKGQLANTRVTTILEDQATSNWGSVTQSKKTAAGVRRHGTTGTEMETQWAVVVLAPGQLLGPVSGRCTGRRRRGSKTRTRPGELRHPLHPAAHRHSDVLFREHV
jgi:hypothetical protein